MSTVFNLSGNDFCPEQVLAELSWLDIPLSLERWMLDVYFCLNKKTQYILRTLECTNVSMDLKFDIVIARLGASIPMFQKRIALI